MPEEDKQRKKTDIEQLRMVLDNPYDTRGATKDHPLLDSVRRRLTGEKPPAQLPPTHPDFLKPHVTIHGSLERTTPPHPPQIQQPAPAPQPILKQKKETITEIIDADDLYEIEKIPATQPQPEHHETIQAPPQPAEWIPVDVVPETPEPIIEKPAIICEKPPEPMLPPVSEEDLIVFKDLNLDTSTARLLYQHGFTSLESIRDASLDTFIKKGIEKKVAKKVKREIAHFDKQKVKQKSTETTITVSVQTSPVDEPITPQPEEPPKEHLPLWEAVEEVVTDEWEQKPEPTPQKKPAPTKPVSTEWETDKSLEEPPSEKPLEQGYVYGEYTLYKKEMTTDDGKIRTIHFFSKTQPVSGEPSALPEGFEVGLNKKTGLPFLRKKTT